MAEDAAPLLTAKIKLPYHLWLRLVVWPDMATLRANVRAGDNWHCAIFVGEFEGPCIGTMNLAATDLTTDTRNHEWTHMVDHFAFRAWDEKKAQMSGRAAAEVESALKQAHLL